MDRYTLYAANYNWTKHEDAKALETRIEKLEKALRDIARGQLQMPGPFEHYAVLVAKTALEKDT